MKKSTKKLLMIVFTTVVLAVCFAVTSFAANADIYDSLAFKANVSDSNTAIETQIAIDGGRYLFLPSSADLTNLVLYYDTAETVTFSTAKATVNVVSGQAFDLTGLFASAMDEYKVTVTADGVQSSLTIMKSDKVRALFFVSADPVNKGRPWVDKSKSNEAEGAMSLVGVNGTVDYTDEVTEFKGRGNSTFTNFEKKPYQMKIANKTNLIKGSDEKNKKWVLLASAADNTFIRNTITFALADMLNLPYTSTYEFIDLYYDGEYRGHYLLTEKVEVDKTRVDIDDLDSLIEDLNEDTNAYENPVVVTKTTASKGNTNAAADSSGSYKFVQGLIEPELPEGASHHAYLLELEFMSRYPDEQSGFVTKKGQAVLTKNPEYLTKETGAFISAFWQEFENAVYSKNGYNTATGKYYYEYCDMDSLVKLYLINEIGKNVDGFRSSTFFYLPEDEDIMYAGPVWDYDRSYGVGVNNKQVSSNPSYFYCTKRYLIDGLMQIESFRNAVKKALDPKTGEFYNAVMELLGSDGIIAQHSEIVSHQQKLNFKIWKMDTELTTVVLPGAANTYENSVEFLEYFIENRINWLSNEVSKWEGSKYTITTDDDAANNSLSFFDRIIQFFQSIIDWFLNLFSF